MQYHRLGNSDLIISEISLGCMSFSENHAENEILVDKAIELGINFFDTADLYDKGLNEISLGKAIRGKRDKVLIASKVGNQWRADGSGWDWNPSKSYILSSIHQSLQRLKTDYLDLYQLHGGTIEDNIEESIEAFEILKQKGLIRAYGISSIRPNVIKAWSRLSNISSVMTQYSLLDRRPEEFSLDHLHQASISVLVRGALAKGLLANKAAKGYLGYSEEEVQSLQDELEAMANKQRSKGQIALQYALGHPVVASLLCGASKSEQIEENVGASALGPMKLEDRINLQSRLRPMIYEKHRV